MFSYHTMIIHRAALLAAAVRTPSISTFDSLELGRYSDDGREADEKVAGETICGINISLTRSISVLEFELRKAYDTIKSLRGSLTKASDISPSTRGEQSPPASSLSEVGRDHIQLYINVHLMYTHHVTKYSTSN